MQKIIIAFLVGLAIGVAGFVGYKLSMQEQPLGAQSVSVSSGNCFVSPDSGVNTCYTRKAFSTATTTVCAIQSPNATSTLITSGAGASGVRFNVSTTSHSLVTIAKATTAFATTTLLGSQVNVATSSKDTLLASTTASQFAAEAHIFAPLEWLVVGMQASPIGDPNAQGTYSPTGICQAVFEVI